MLPDFPAEKATLWKFLDRYSKRKFREYQGIFAEVPVYRHYEGESWSLRPADGTVRKVDYRELESLLTVEFGEVPTLSLGKAMDKMDAVAQDMARQMVRQGFDVISQACDESGQTVDAGGRRLTKELFLDLVDLVLIPFDKDGNPQFPAIVMHPKLWEAVGEDMKSWDRDPEFRARSEAMIQRKREEWRDRESRRKLVD